MDREAEVPLVAEFSEGEMCRRDIDHSDDFGRQLFQAPQLLGYLLKFTQKPTLVSFMTSDLFGIHVLAKLVFFKLGSRAKAKACPLCVN